MSHCDYEISLANKNCIAQITKKCCNIWKAKTKMLNQPKTIGMRKKMSKKNYIAKNRTEQILFRCQNNSNQVVHNNYKIQTLNLTRS